MFVRALAFRLTCLVVVAGGAWATPPSSPDAAARIEVEGIASGVGEAGRLEALKNAKLEVLLQVIEKTAPGYEKELFDVVRLAPEAYLERLNILREWHGEEMTRVRIEAWVAYKALRLTIARLVLPRIEYPPVVLVMLDHHGEKVPENPSESVLRDALAQEGILLADAEALRARYVGHGLPGLLAWKDPERSRRFVRDSQADIVVMGHTEMSVEHQRGESLLVSCHARITVRVVRAGDGKLVETQTAEAIVNTSNRVTGMQLALRDAAMRLSNAVFMSVVLAAADTPEPSALMISLELPGMSAPVEPFMRMLREMGGDDSVKQLFSSPELLRLEWDYDGSLKRVMERVQSGLYGGCRIEPREVVGRRMDLIAVPDS